MADAEGEFAVYARHVVALFWPNKAAPSLVADENEPGEMDGWDEDELRILIDEGRRQLDRQHEDLERIRGRSQVLLAFGLALEGSIASLQSQLVDRASWADRRAARPDHLACGLSGGDDRLGSGWSGSTSVGWSPE
jgi:hypothetical protein